MSCPCSAPDPSNDRAREEGRRPQTRYLRQRYAKKLAVSKKPSGWTLSARAANYLASSAPVQPIDACAARRRAEAAQQIRPFRFSYSSSSLARPLVDHRPRSTTFCSFAAHLSRTAAVRVHSSRCTLPSALSPSYQANHVSSSSPTIPVASSAALAGSTSTSPAEHHERPALNHFAPQQLDHSRTTLHLITIANIHQN